ncbi:astacin-like metalloprotease toxin 3 [Centruroides sculpturatus]|uniref:astacin-like metalloprotease toxin 3 n=1 Tax=Centruroides sculpturatus TaxID=218467 RepID=UPI000C6DBB47|nr:astacin-like metalloprotease toxin 3 [Centruroides sculpturatus]
MICLAIFLVFSNFTNLQNFENVNQEYSEDSADADLALQNPDLSGGDMIGDIDFIRGAVPKSSDLWPEGIIPYVIEEELLSSNKTKWLIKAAMMNFQRSTCIRFIERTNEETFVRIFKGPGCYASVGRDKGEHSVSLSDGCMYFGTIVHELNHIVGFYHEQNRPDRDEYIKILWENIKPHMESQFVKFGPHQMRILNNFDYTSIMLYGERFFSKDGRSRTMIAKRPGVRLVNISSKPGLSKSDIFRINTLYNCNNSNKKS